jgi:hypothetical protein
LKGFWLDALVYQALEAMLFFYHNRFGPVKFEPFALSLSKGFDPSTSSGQAKLSLNGS